MDRDLSHLDGCTGEDPHYCLPRRPYFWQIVIEFVKGGRELVDHFVRVNIGCNHKTCHEINNSED